MSVTSDSTVERRCASSRYDRRTRARVSSNSRRIVDSRPENRSSSPFQPLLTVGDSLEPSMELLAENSHVVTERLLDVVCSLPVHTRSVAHVADSSGPVGGDLARYSATPREANITAWRSTAPWPDDAQ